MAIRVKDENLAREASQVLRACFEEIPFVQISALRAADREGDPDLLARLELPEGELTLIVALKSSGQPRLARDAINQLIRYVSEDPSAYGVFMAPYISPRSASICEKENIGYLDLAGNCRLCFGNVYIRKASPGNPYAQKRELRTLYSPKASRILRVLLSEPRKPWRVQKLAEEADVSLGQVSNVKKLLTDREWIRFGEAGFQLVDPKALLSEWAENQRYRRDKPYSFYALESGAEIEARLAETCQRRGISYALTSFSAAARMAPMVRSQRTVAYVACNPEDLTQELKLKKVTSGANLKLIEPVDEGVFYGMTDWDGIAVASAIQTYLDLKREGGRGEEAAEAILNEMIRPRW